MGNIQLRHEIVGKRGPIYRTGWSFDGKVLASAHGTGILRFWNGKTGLLVNQHEEHKEITVRCLAWSKGDYRIATGDTDGDIVIWDYGKNELILRIKAHENRVRTVAWSPDGSRIVSGSSDGYVRTWDAKSGKELKKSKNVFAKGAREGRPTIYSVKWSPDGKQLASCRGNSSVIWDANTYRETFTLDGHTDLVRSVAWSNDGTLFASCSNDATIRIWNARTRKEVCTLTLERADIAKDTSIFCVHFSQNGEFVAGKSTDNSVRLWRIQDGTCVVKLAELCGAGTGENLGGLAFHPKEPLLVTLRNHCKNLRIWQLDYGSLSRTSHCENINHGFKSSIVRSIDFPAHLAQAGLGILSFLGKVLNDKFPYIDVSVQIKQANLNVTLTIEVGEDDREVIEEALNDYSRVVSGEMPVDQYLENAIQILDLKNQLRIAAVQIESQKDLLKLQDVYVHQLLGLVSQALQQPPGEANTPSPTSVTIRNTTSVRTMTDHSNRDSSISGNVSGSNVNLGDRVSQDIKALPERSNSGKEFADLKTILSELVALVAAARAQGVDSEACDDVLLNAQEIVEASHKSKDGWADVVRKSLRNLEQIVLSFKNLLGISESFQVLLGRIGSWL